MSRIHCTVLPSTANSQRGGVQSSVPQTTTSETSNWSHNIPRQKLLQWGFIVDDREFNSALSMGSEWAAVLSPSPMATQIDPLRRSWRMAVIQSRNFSGECWAMFGFQIFVSAATREDDLPCRIHDGIASWQWGSEASTVAHIFHDWKSQGPLCRLTRIIDWLTVLIKLLGDFTLVWSFMALFSNRTRSSRQ